MMEITGTTDVCFTPIEYFDLQNQIMQSHVQWGIICMVIGFSVAKVVPVIAAYIRTKYYGKPAE